MNQQEVEKFIKKCGGKKLKLAFTEVGTKPKPNEVKISFKRLDLTFNGKHYVKKFYRDEFKNEVYKKVKTMMVKKPAEVVKFFIHCTKDEPKYQGLSFLSPENITRPMIKYVKDDKGETKEIIIKPKKKMGRPKKTEKQLAAIERANLKKKAKAKEAKERKKHNASLLKLRNQLINKLKKG